MALEKEEIENLEFYISEYSSELYNSYPIFFDNISYINSIATYICSICLDFFEENETFVYENDVDFITLIKYCEDITNSIGIEYKNIFQERLSDGTINFGFSKEGSIAYTSSTEKHNDIFVDRNYTIEDIIKTIHELFHEIHVCKFENKFKDQECYFYSEFVALIGDMYSIFYLYKNNILKKDCLTYFKKLFYSLNSIANTTLIEGITLDIYNKMQKLDEESVLDYIKITNSPNEYSIIPELNKQIGEYDYHICATYVFGFVFSFLISEAMIQDEFYLEKFKMIMKNINQYNFSDILLHFGIKGVLTDSDKLYSAVLHMYNALESMKNKNEINIKASKGDLW